MKTQMRTRIAEELLARQGFYKITGNPDAEWLVKTLTARPELVPSVRQHVEKLIAELDAAKATILGTGNATSGK